MAEIEVGGVKLHVQRLGDSPREVVFLHGLVMDNLSSWYFTAATRVATSRGVLLYDLRGHGRSKRPETGYRLEDLVAELLGVLDAEGVERAHLVGNSFGGLLAVAFALAHPERVASLFLVDALLPTAGWGERMVGTLGLTGDARDATIGRLFENWLGRHSERKRNKLAKQASALVEGTTLLADLRGSASFAPDALEALTMPIRAIYGAESDVLPDGRLLAEHAADVSLTVLDGCSHSVMWEATEAVVSGITGWLAR
ncbi:MAG: alpha/beta fold hydrolase [Deltaproteobacteria bacterium]|nr:MAG: alpha/beta fold hydrolase [Deltaproteobacteria bacterium]